MLALALTVCLAASGPSPQRAADAPTAVVPLAPLPDGQALLAERLRQLPSARQFPRPPILRFLLDSAKTMARPFNPEPTDFWLTAPAVAGTLVAYSTDVATYHAIQKVPDPVVLDHKLSYWVSFMGEGWVDVTIFAVLGVVGGRDEQRAALAGLQGLLAVGAVTRAAKYVMRYERPSYDPDHQHLFSESISADAMPSGHTAAAFVTATVLAQEYPKAAPVFFLLATWVAFARVQQSAHWLSDTVAAAAIGILMGWESYRLTRAFELEVQPWFAPTGAGLQLGHAL